MIGKLSVKNETVQIASENSFLKDMAVLFDVRSGDYNGEKLLEHNGTRYRIYTTFVSRNGEFTELKVTDLSERGAGNA